MTNASDYSRATADEDQLIARAAVSMRQMLLDRRNAAGIWVGCLSSSALSTATATLALQRALEIGAAPTDSDRQRFQQMIGASLRWLAEHQNPDGGWGDTILSVSNISTTMLVHAVLVATGRTATGRPSDSAPFDAELSVRLKEIEQQAADYIARAGGVDAVLKRYGRDRTFSIPILTHCALAGTVGWNQVLPLPFELACVPAKFYAAVRMPVVSYALPALIAIGQVIFHHRGHWNPIVSMVRRAAIAPSLKVLESIQPPNGGFLEATPLTSFVCMSLLGCGLSSHPVTQRCLRFITSSVRDDGSWPIDTNLTTWVTTLSVNALATDAGPESTAVVEGMVSLDFDDRSAVRDWLLKQQFTRVHPYTNAAPGGWSWTDLPGGVPDADDTPGAILALLNLRFRTEEFTAQECEALSSAVGWLLNLQNRDGGWPTFCRGWGTLPFDRSSCDLTAHAIRAIREWSERSGNEPVTTRTSTLAAINRGLAFLKRNQQPDGSWLPLWFGNQFHAEDQNPMYGTAKVLMALDRPAELNDDSGFVRKAVRWMLDQQNSDGGWSACRGLISSVEETGLAVEALSAPSFVEIPEVSAATRRGALWLSSRVNEGTVSDPTPIGFYFAKLWYFEALYPIIFASSGLNRWLQTNCNNRPSSRQ